MADDRARQMTQTALNQLEAELKAGNSERLEKLFDTMSRFPTYSWSNNLLISHQRPTATQLGSMHKWEKLGRSVIDGEKPITILAPVFKRDQDRAQTPPTPGQTSQKDGASRLVGFRPA